LHIADSGSNGNRSFDVPSPQLMMHANVHCIFDASDYGIIGNVSRNPYHKQVTQALIEYQLGRNS
jgi:hypothetical protein